MNRRAFLASVASAVRAAQAAPTPIGLGLGNYGLKSYRPVDAVKFVSSIGYDSFELCLMPGWPSDTANLAPAARREVRAALEGEGLPVPSMLEGINILGDHKANLERIRRDMQLGHDCDPAIGGVKPCLQTHLGGKDSEWEARKHQLVDLLGEWGRVAAGMKMVLAFKGHNLNMPDTSGKTLWLIQKVNSPWIRVIYDYSHFQASGETLADSLTRLLPYTYVISIKDGKNYPDKPGYQRLLPGEGTIDYVDYYRRLMLGGYKGHTIVEVSAQIQNAPGYDPVYASKKPYQNIAPLMAKAGVPRPRRGG